jgi:hypothetical protein
MPFATSETINARLVVNPKIATRSRITALRELSRPKLGMLWRLMLDPDTPSRLLVELSRAYKDTLLHRSLTTITAAKSETKEESS